MSIHVMWDNDEKTVVRYVYEGRWTWEDFEAARREAAELLKTVNHQVDVIVDVQDSKLLPNSAISRGRELSKSDPTVFANEGITVIVGASTFVRAMYDMTVKIYPALTQKQGYRFVKGLAEARSLIEQHRSISSSTS